MSVDLEQMKADRARGTPGPWSMSHRGSYSGITHQPTKNNPMGGLIVKMHAGRPELPADARRIARVPDLEALVIEQAERIAELEAALDGIRQYANDTLSGRADGPDDRAWQREGVIEMRNRARAALEPKA